MAFIDCKYYQFIVHFYHRTIDHVDYVATQLLSTYIPITIQINGKLRAILIPSSSYFAIHSASYSLLYVALVAVLAYEKLLVCFNRLG